MAPRARGSARFLSACESLALQVRPPPELQPRHHPWMTAWVVLTRPAQTTSLLAPSQSSPCLENHPDNPPGLIWIPYYSAGSISWNKFRFFFYIGCVGFVLFSSYPGQSVCPLCRSLNTLRQSRILWDIMTTAEASLCSCRHSSWKAKSCRYEGEIVKKKKKESLIGRWSVIYGLRCQSPPRSQEQTLSWGKGLDLCSRSQHDSPPKRHASPFDLLPPPGEIPNLLSSYRCPPALPFSLCLLQLLPSTQDLPEMCRWWLPSNTTVLLKLQMESSQSGLWLAGDLQ